MSQQLFYLSAALGISESIMFPWSQAEETEETAAENGGGGGVIEIPHLTLRSQDCPRGVVIRPSTRSGVALKQSLQLKQTALVAI